MSCPSCNGDEFVEDNSQSLTQRVCINCGTVVGVTNELTSAADMQPMHTLSSYSNFNRKRPFYTKSNTTNDLTYTYKAAIAELNGFAIHCSASSVIVKEAEQLFKDAYFKPSLKYLHADKKSILAVTCFYLTARKYATAISISDAALFLRVPTCEISDIYKIVKEEFQIDITTPDPEELVEGFLNQENLKQLSSSEMIRKMKEILNLSKKSLLSTGVGTQQLLLAVCYIAWCSLNVRLRKLPTFYKFCDEHSVKKTYGTAAVKRVGDITQMLIDLTKNLPSLSNMKIDKKSIFFHMDTILSFPTMAMAMKEGTLNDEQSTYTFVRKSTTKRRCMESNESEEVLNFCGDLDRPELDEEDIPDSEMHQYLRNDEEINFVKTLQK
ncbi:Transcription factor IIIB 50 kDa subunit [Chamberlinius hualienensis]